MNSDDILPQQRAWLDKLQTISRKPILVKAIESGTTPNGAGPEMYYWRYYKDIWHKLKQPIYTRGILQNEICLDPDLKDWNRLTTELKKIQAYCTKDNVPIELAYSGGSGIHGHIFFDSFGIDEDNFQKAKTYDIDLYKVVRNILLDIILEGAGTNKLALGLDSKKINFSKDRKGSQVREYGTLRPDGNYKTLITEIPETRPAPGSLPLVFPTELKPWQVPEKYNKKINDRIREETKKATEYHNYNLDSIDLQGNKLEKFPCIKTLFKIGATAGKRYYGSNSIVLMAKKCGYSWTAVEELIHKFFSRCEITEAEAKLRIDNNKPLFDSSDYNFSCRAIKEVFGKDICNFSKCPICDHVKDIREQEKADKTEEVPQHIKDSANQLLDEGEALNFLMKTCSKIHIGDETTIKATFGAIGTQSVLNSAGIQPKVSGGTGKGKSHAEKTVIHMVPREYVEETSLSGKALFHADIKTGTIIFSDDADPSEDIQNLIKRCTTNFQTVTKHKISVKNDGEWTSKNVMIPPRIVFILTSVADNVPTEYLNRQFNLGVDESTAQDDRVWDLLVEKAATGEADFPINDDVLICREIVRDIKQHLFSVRIPYSRRIVFNDRQNRRNGAQFLDFIMAFAVFNYRLRQKTDDNTIDANEDDFREALSLYGQRAPNQKLKLNDNEISVLKCMSVGKEYTIESLQQLTNKSYRTIYNTFHGRDGRTGLLEKVPGLTYRPETEFLGESEITGSGEYEKAYTTVRKTKPRHVYILTTDFNSLLSFGTVAELPPEAP